MSKFTFQGALLAVDGLDLSLSANQVSVDNASELQDVTAIGNTARARLAGLQVATIGASGFWQATPEDEDLFAARGLAGKVIIASPGATEGDVAYALNAILGEYSPIQAGVGEATQFDLSAGARDDLVRATLMHTGQETADGDGITRQLGAPASGERVIGGVCVTAAAGTSPTLDIVVESDAADDFTGLETTRLTFPQFTGRGSSWQTLAGPISDDWWRFSWTVGGTSPDFTWVGIIGVQ